MLQYILDTPIHKRHDDFILHTIIVNAEKKTSSQIGISENRYPMLLSRDMTVRLLKRHKYQKQSNFIRK